MTFPAIAGQVVSSHSASVTAHVVTFDQAAVAGELLIGWVFHDGNATWTADTANGWALLASGNISTVASMAIVWKRATGGETQTTVTSSVAERSTHIGQRITGAHASSAPEVSTATTGSSNAPNPGALDPAGWATEDTLWIAGYGVDSGEPSAYPLAGNNLSTGVSPTSAAYGGVCATQSAVASLDVGAFTNTTADDWRAYTIAIRPVPAGAVVATPTPFTLTMSMSSPTVTATAHKIAEPTPFALALTMSSPSVSKGDTRTPTPFALALTMSSPTVTATAHKIATPAPFALALTMSSPTVTVGAGVTDTKVTPTPFALTMTMSSPTVTATAHRSSTPAPFALVLTMSSPEVTIAGPGAGGGRPPMLGPVVLEPPSIRPGARGPVIGAPRG